MKESVCVSVVMITYGHEMYIKQAVEGILMQESDFKIELIIADDNSPDNTENVVSKIINEHPRGHTVKYTRHIQNMGMMSNFVWALQQGTGKYIALCEGDDYWVDPLKLQKQFDFMESNEDCSICFHAWENVIASKHNIVKRPFKIPINNKFDIKDVILGGGGFMATNSMFFKAEYILEKPQWLLDSPVGDSPLMLLLATQGKIGYIDNVMSAYRVNTAGSWSTQNFQNKSKRREHNLATIKMWDAFDVWTEKEYTEVIRKKKCINKKSKFKASIFRILKYLKLK